MKETVNVNIASQAFTIDTDACEMLRGYLDDVRQRLPEWDTETMNDIENGMAEIFREYLPSPLMVVTADMVRRAIARMGGPEEFGQPKSGAAQDAQNGSEAARPVKRLYRSRSNCSIAGLCGGLAEYLGADVTLLRLLTLFLILFGGVSIWVYIIMWIVVPQEPNSKNANNIANYGNNQ